MNAFKTTAAAVYILSCIALIWLVDLQSPVKYSIIFIPMALYIAISKMHERSRDKKAGKIA